MKKNKSEFLFYNHYGLKRKLSYSPYLGSVLVLYMYNIVYACFVIKYMKMYMYYMYGTHIELKDLSMTGLYKHVLCDK